jgi:serine/threonine protein phosphatase 1
MKTIAFVGDVHGSIDALDGALDILHERAVEHVVFLGDYLNKGTESNAVLARLVPMVQRGSVTLLRGNHETELLRAIDDQNLTSFLKMGGAATIRAYVGGDVGPNVLRDFSRAIPREHLDAIRAMPFQFQTIRVIAQHEPLGATSRWRWGRYSVTAHRPTGPKPRIGRRSAEIDTGCGDIGGRLTALLWPSREYLQVDLTGARV